MKTRIITAICALALFVPIVIIGGLPLTIAIYVLASVGLFELFRMKRFHLFSFPVLFSFILLWILIFPNRYIDLLHQIHISKTGFLFFGAILLLIYTVFSKNQFSFDDVGFALIAIIYVGVGFYFFIEMRVLGLDKLLFALLTIWATDSGAYFIGRAFGKKKLSAEISPNKTVEGFFGGIFSAILVGLIFHYFTNFLPTYVQTVFVSVIVSIVGQMGDLVQSAFKRHYGTKDSGTIFPGHGGVLDRFDSLIFIMPILYFFIQLISRQGVTM